MATSNGTLLEWVSGEGQVRRRDGTTVGTRHYDIEVWQHGNPAAHPGAGPGTAPPTSLRISIDFSDAERAEFATKGTELLLLLEDGRQVEFVVRDVKGTIVPKQGELRRRRPPRALGLAALLILAGLAYLVTQFGIGSVFVSWFATTPYALPVGLALLALAVVVVGMKVAPRSRQPGYFMFGVVLVAIGIVSLYALPIGTLLIVKKVGGPDELGGILAVLAMAFGGMLLIGGGWAAISDAW
ncbi:MAG TPA: hypothetical protein VES67_19460 [Vicinamibacterales bacterium]|nr:hypothetical protein [Vicinamibacterales bacterium]